MAVSRDGVSLGIAPFGNFEMASVVTVSVYDIGNLNFDICGGDGERISTERSVDYDHAGLRLTTIADALLLTSSQCIEWLRWVHMLLLERGGWGRVMRSIGEYEAAAWR